MEGEPAENEKIEVTIEEVNHNDLDKEVEKPKKPRTEKQIAAFKKAQETRKNNILMREDMKAEKKAQAKAERDEIKEELKKRRGEKARKVVKPKREKTPEFEYSSSEEEEVEYVKKPKRKTKKKKVVYVSSSSSEESSSDEEYEPPTKQLQRQKAYVKKYQEPEINYPVRCSDVFKFV